MVNCCAARELAPGLLLDPGIALAKSITRTCRRIPKILADAASQLTTRPQRLLYDFLQKSRSWFIESEPCRCIPKI
jgi:hypothetical protein